MAINLRENKIDNNTTQNSVTNLNANNTIRKIVGATPKKKLPAKQSQRKLKQSSYKKIQSAQEYNEINTNQQNEKNNSEKWTRKQPKQPIPESELDYQQNIEYKSQHSTYLQNNMDDVLLHWRGPDYERYPRSKRWYTWAVIALVAVIVYAVFTEGYIMAFVFILIGVVGYLQISQPPTVIDFAIMYNGILVGEELYEFDNIKSFWIFYEPPHTRVISLYVKGHFKPYLHIPLHQVDPVEVHVQLTKFIPEVRQEQNIIDVLERLLHM